jgi:hypothetical protein
MPDHPSTFMKMVKGRSQAISAANDERRQVLPSRVIWDGSIDRFELFRNSVEGHYGQIGAGYLFDTDFQTAYLEKGVDCFVDFMDEVPTASQIKKDARALYGALLSACQCGIGRRILMENRNKQDGIRAWYQLVNQYETDGNRNVRIKKLENVITTVFHRHYKGRGCLNGYKIMKMPSQNLFYLAKILGKMMTSRNEDWCRMHRILAWLIPFLKHW